ncbi:MAG: SprB repeat-containing protein, partial [Polaribacter sp.]|nr:SprB repeat-containing protein [Polaribacter sp.]
MKKAITPPKKHLIYMLFVAFGVLVSFKGSAQLTIPGVIINSCSGSITVSADGGVQPYAYQWFKKSGTVWNLLPNEDYFVLSGQAPGSYKVIVSDANGAEVIGEYDISEPVALYVNEIFTGLACAEDPNSGVIILRFENGIPPYDWTLTGSSASFTTRAGTVTPTGTPYYLSLDDIPVGDYTFSWADDFGCSGTEEITVSTPPITELTVNTTTDVICFGDSNGEVNVSVTGGWGASYAINIVPDGQAPQAIGSWTDIGDGTNYTVNNLPAGTYQIYYYDKLANPPLTTTYGLDVSSYNCSKFETFTIGTPAELISTPSGELLSCFGNTDGNITGTITGGTAPYTITLDETGTQFTGITDGGAFDFSGLGAGTYNFTIIDAASCSIITQTSITQPAELTTGFVSKQDVSCNAGADGNIVVSVTGGTAPYIFEVDGITVTPTLINGNNFTIGNLSAGSYSIAVTDQNNCTATTTITQTITEPTALSVAILGEALTCFGDSDGNITGSISGGTAPYTIALDGTGTQFTGIADGGAFDFSGLSAGTYTFTITDAASCTTTTQETITQPNEIQASSTGSLLLCFGDSDGNITGTISGGTAPYAIVLDETAAQFTGITDGGSFDFSGLAAGTYNFTITDAASCSIITQASITQPDELTTSFVSKQDVSCNAGTDGNVIVSVTGGTAPYIFKVAGVIVTPTLISGTNYTIGNLEASNHTITITDQSSCANSITQVITQPEEISLSLVSFQNLSCFNAGNGAITVGVTGGTPSYIFTLTGPSNATAQDNGNGTWTFTSLDAGTYTISVTDQNNCTSNPTQISQELTQPIEVTFDALPQNVSCFGLTDGTITIPNYTTDYNYEIVSTSSLSVPITTFSVQGTSLVYTDLPVDSYRVKVWILGNNGASCPMFRFIDINEPAEVTLTSSSVSNFYAGTGSPINISCNGASDGSVDITMSGGIGPYSYIWTTVDGSIPTGTENDEGISGLTAGTYSVQVSDQNSCQKSFNFTLSEPRILNNTAIATQNNGCFNGESGALISQITTSGSVDGIIYTYTVVGSPALPSSYPAVQTTTNLSATFSNLPSGDYQVQVVDQNGCTSTSPLVTITQPTAILNIDSGTLSSHNGFNISCNGSDDGSIDIAVSGGAGTYTYSWTGP